MGDTKNESKLLHDVKIKISAAGRGEVFLDDKPLMTSGTKVITRAGYPPEVTIYTWAETLEQEVVTDDLTIAEVEPSARVWLYADAPERYRNLSSTKWDTAWVRRVPKPVKWHGSAGLAFSSGNNLHEETYELDDLHEIVIWGWVAE